MPPAIKMGALSEAAAIRQSVCLNHLCVPCTYLTNGAFYSYMVTIEH